jgi:hypothetical protein
MVRAFSPVSLPLCKTAGSVIFDDDVCSDGTVTAQAHHHATVLSQSDDDEVDTTDVTDEPMASADLQSDPVADAPTKHGLGAGQGVAGELLPPPPGPELAECADLGHSLAASWLVGGPNGVPPPYRPLLPPEAPCLVELLVRACWVPLPGARPTCAAMVPLLLRLIDEEGGAPPEAMDVLRELRGTATAAGTVPGPAMEEAEASAARGDREVAGHPEPEPMPEEATETEAALAPSGSSAATPARVSQGTTPSSTRVAAVPEDEASPSWPATKHEDKDGGATSSQGDDDDDDDDDGLGEAEESVPITPRHGDHDGGAADLDLGFDFASDFEEMGYTPQERESDEDERGAEAETPSADEGGGSTRHDDAAASVFGRRPVAVLTLEPVLTDISTSPPPPTPDDAGGSGRLASRATHRSAVDHDAPPSSSSSSSSAAAAAPWAVLVGWFARCYGDEAARALGRLQKIDYQEAVLPRVVAHAAGLPSGQKAAAAAAAASTAPSSSSSSSSSSPSAEVMALRSQVVALQRELGEQRRRGAQGPVYQSTRL